MHDVIIIGGGPAGLAAAWQAANAGISVLVVAEHLPEYHPEPHPMLLNFQEIKRQVHDLAHQKPEHLFLMVGRKVVGVERHVVSFSVELASGEQLYCRSVIEACGVTDGEGNASFERLTLKDGRGRIKTDPDGRTNVPGLFAAGAASVGAIKNTFTAIGEGVRAALCAQLHLRKERT